MKTWDMGAGSSGGTDVARLSMNVGSCHPVRTGPPRLPLPAWQTCPTGQHAAAIRLSPARLAPSNLPRSAGLSAHLIRPQGRRSFPSRLLDHLSASAQRAQHGLPDLHRRYVASACGRRRTAWPGRARATLHFWCGQWRIGKARRNGARRRCPGRALPGTTGSPC